MAEGIYKTCVRYKMTPGGKKCAEYEPLSGGFDMSDIGKLQPKYRHCVMYKMTPGGRRCAKFEPLSGLGQLGARQEGGKTKRVCIRYKVSPAGRRCAEYGECVSYSKKTGECIKAVSLTSEATMRRRRWLAKKRKEVAESSYIGPTAAASIISAGRKASTKSIVPLRGVSLGDAVELAALDDGGFGKLYYCGPKGDRWTCIPRKLGEKKPKGFIMVQFPKSKKRVTVQKALSETRRSNIWLAEAAQACKGKKRPEFLKCVKAAIKQIKKEKLI